LSLLSVEDGTRITKEVPASPATLDGLDADTTYQVTVMAVGKNGAKSVPSNTLSLETPASAAAGTSGMVVLGGLDAVGLRISWDFQPSFPVAGYLLYRQPASGQAERLMAEPAKKGPFWLLDPSKWRGSRFIVKAVRSDNGAEVAVGSYLFNLGSNRIQAMGFKPSLGLKVGVLDNQELEVEWDHDEGDLTSLLVAEGSDQVFYQAAVLNSRRPSNRLKGFDSGHYRFIVADQDTNGVFTANSNPVEVTLP